ncbi:hypothetical protein CA984_02740 [Streptosporangium minutum]|uniref:Uncharacterized protein n=1 Tax=Streptosporangium minutum TaxID=569862 RepID=A0A243RY58_9ACTN|nr:hypothetical protein CA984_02740 [Streptosporangium minutum]
MEDDGEVPDEGEAEKAYIEVCVRKGNRIRVADQRCDDAERGYSWYFIPAEKRVPALGKRAGKGSLRKPSGEILRAAKKGGRGNDVSIVDVEDRVMVCVRKETRTRVSDRACNGRKRIFRWYYIRIDRHVPAVGEKAEAGSFRVPYGDTYNAIQKGGIGTKAAIDYEDYEDSDIEDDTDDGSNDTATDTDTDTDRVTTGCGIGCRRCTGVCNGSSSNGRRRGGRR